MSRYTRMDEWYTYVAESLLPPTERDPRAYWQYQLAGRYRADILPTRDRLWYRAAELLVQYGVPRVRTNGAMDSRPLGAALSTGAMAVGGVRKQGGTRVAEAIRLSVATPGLSYAQLPMDEIRRRVSSGRTRKLDNAVKQLAEFPGLTSIQLEAFKVSTRKRALVRKGVEPKVLREAIAPRSRRGSMTAGAINGHFGDDILARVLGTAPELAVWCVPMSISAQAGSEACISKPQMPQLETLEDGSVSEYRQAAKDTLNRAHLEQPYTREMLTKLEAVTIPLRAALGEMAVLSWCDEV